MNLDAPLRPDIVDILDTAAVLEISEFRVFEIAYAEWYGRPGPSDLLERSFSNYMYHDLVPAWVRQFTRHVLDLRDAGRLTPETFGIHPETPTPTTVYLGIRYAIWIALAMGMIFMAAVFAEGPSGCFFPPCY